MLTWMQAYPSIYAAACKAAEMLLPLSKEGLVDMGNLSTRATAGKCPSYLLPACPVVICVMMSLVINLTRCAAPFKRNGQSINQGNSQYMPFHLLFSNA